jgi:hypothetical protein
MPTEEREDLLVFLYACLHRDRIGWDSLSVLECVICFFLELFMGFKEDIWFLDQQRFGEGCERNAFNVYSSVAI